MSGKIITIEVSDDDADGICVATMYEDGIERCCFETTQGEMKAYALSAGGFSVPDDMAREAEAETARRESLGRTLFEEMVSVVNIDLPQPCSCRVCSCTDFSACIGEDGQPCHWVEPDLCSVCNARLMAV